MTSVVVKDLKGKKVGEKELLETVFAVEPNAHLIHSALTRQLANARSGSANSKTRAEVRGGGRKPWKQKGTGRARAGSIRSPLWAGGGVIFGPKPRDFSITMPRKARQQALRSALSARAEQLVVVQNFDGLFKSAPKADSTPEQPKTKEFVALLKELGLSDKWVLVVLDHKQPGASQIERAARNIPALKVIDFSNMNIKDLAQSDAVLTTEHVLEQIENRFKPCGNSSSADACGKKEARKPTEKAAKAADKASAKTAAKASKAEKPAEAKAKEPKAAKEAAPKKAAAHKKAEAAETKAPKARKKKSGEGEE